MNRIVALTETRRSGSPKQYWEHGSCCSINDSFFVSVVRCAVSSTLMDPYQSTVVEQLALNCQFVLSEDGMSQVDHRLATVNSKRLLKASCPGVCPARRIRGARQDDKHAYFTALHLSNRPACLPSCMTICKTQVRSTTAHIEQRDGQGRYRYESTICERSLSHFGSSIAINPSTLWCRIQPPRLDHANADGM